MPTSSQACHAPSRQSVYPPIDWLVEMSDDLVPRSFLEGLAVGRRTRWRHCLKSSAYSSINWRRVYSRRQKVKTVEGKVEGTMILKAILSYWIITLVGLIDLITKSFPGPEVIANVRPTVRPTVLVPAYQTPP